MASVAVLFVCAITAADTWLVVGCVDTGYLRCSFRLTRSNFQRVCTILEHNSPGKEREFRSGVVLQIIQQARELKNEQTSSIEANWSWLHFGLLPSSSRSRTLFWLVALRSKYDVHSKVAGFKAYVTLSTTLERLLVYGFAWRWIESRTSRAMLMRVAVRCRRKGRKNEDAARKKVVPVDTDWDSWCRQVENERGSRRSENELIEREVDITGAKLYLIWSPTTWSVVNPVWDTNSLPRKDYSCLQMPRMNPFLPASDIYRIVQRN